MTAARSARRVACSAAEWAARADLAALFRLAHHFGWTDLTSTHITARIPDDPGCYLINGYDLLWEEITASRLYKLTFDGLLP